jgi:hypothetical protein
VIADPRKREELIERIHQARLMVRTPSGPERRKIKRWYDYIAQRLFKRLYTLHETVFPGLDTVCDKRDDLFFLNVNKFGVWLAATNILPEHQKALALFACAFGILQPREAPEILETLINRDSSFREWLSDDTISLDSDTTSGCQSGEIAAVASDDEIAGRPDAKVTNAQLEVQPHQSQFPQEASEPSALAKADLTFRSVEENAAQVSDALEGSEPRDLLFTQLPLPPDTAELVRLLAEGSDWSRDIPLAKYRADVQLLHNKADQHKAQLRQFELARDALVSFLPGVPLEDATRAESCTRTATNLTTSKAVERLAIPGTSPSRIACCRTTG